ncbi:MAG: sulfite exporter TauE/SafE family protein [Christensenellales bacterium]
MFQRANNLKYEIEPISKKLKIGALEVFAGLVIGFINGYLGAGGGMLVVPVLTFVSGLAEKNAHATAIAIIFPMSVASAIVYVLKGALDTSLLGSVVSGVVLGGILGAVVLYKASNKALTLFFYAVMIAAGIKMVI